MCFWSLNPPFFQTSLTIVFLFTLTGILLLFVLEFSEIFEICFWDSFNIFISFLVEVSIFSEEFILEISSFWIVSVFDCSILFNSNLDSELFVDFFKSISSTDDSSPSLVS